MFQFKNQVTFLRDKYPRILLVGLLDMCVIVIALWLAVLLRSDNILNFRNGAIFNNVPWLVTICISTFVVFNLVRIYTVSWRYAGFREYLRLYICIFISFCLSYGVMKWYLTGSDTRVSNLTHVDFVLCMLLSMAGITIIRLVLASLKTFFVSFKRQNHLKDKSRVLIIGAGDTGTALIKSMMNEGSRIPVAAIDDDRAKHGLRIMDVPVVGDRDDIPQIAESYHIDEIIIAIPESSAMDAYRIATICEETGCKVQSVPSLYEMLSGKANVTQINEVKPQDLLGRDEILVDNTDIFDYISSKSILVTGGGGSIGSELCRQIAKYDPKMLVIFDIYENNAYELQYSLKKLYPNLDLRVLIGSVRDKKRLEEVFEQTHPDVVFHAAAHKHVPLMEDSPNEAIKNNVYGTYNVATTAEAFGVRRFVLISTDKAVNPTNIMGTSKRVAEMVIQQLSLRQKKGGTIFAAVRFGNVLGSNGSVIPLFKQQIASGGPVTVTHPEINRFFMTIPEAAQLVMQAGAFAKGGDIFILDMGQPVKITDLAENLIRLSGLRPNIDIKIEFSGLRPGEKMYEELLLDKTKQDATKHDRIYIEKPITNRQVLVREIQDLKKRIRCDCSLYDTMVDWFINEFPDDTEVSEETHPGRFMQKLEIVSN